MSSRIIGGKRYALEKRNLLCDITVSNPKLLFDLQAKKQRLYFPHGKAFILETVQELPGVSETKVATREEALQFMNEHSEGIIESVYVRYFGKPEEV